MTITFQLRLKELLAFFIIYNNITAIIIGFNIFYFCDTNLYKIVIVSQVLYEIATALIILTASECFFSSYSSSSSENGSISYLVSVGSDLSKTFLLII